MPDPAFVSVADTLGSFTSVIFFIFLGAGLLVLWQVALMLGAVISSIRNRNSQEDPGHLTAG